MRRLGLDRHEVRASAQAQKDPTLAADEGFHLLPAPTGAAPYRLALSSVVQGLSPSSRVLHTMGDTGGIANPVPQQHVVAAMIEDLTRSNVYGVTPEFAFHLGDWAYYEGEQQAWVTQVYEAYEKYTRALLGIPGNHDSFSFADWVRYMCASTPGALPEIAEFHRDTMDQPNPYWTLTDDLVTVIGLATNVPSGGVVKVDQAEWLVEELKAAPAGTALVVALHHPPYSCDAHHGGSATMGKLLDTAFTSAGRWPHLVLSGHVHNYQRLTRTLHEGHTCTYVVAGAGGYHNLHSMAGDAKAGAEVSPGVVLNVAEASRWGFLRLEITPPADGFGAITGEYLAVAADGTVEPNVDTFKIAVK